MSQFTPPAILPPSTPPAFRAQRPRPQRSVLVTFLGILVVLAVLGGIGYGLFELVRYLNRKKTTKTHLDDRTGMCTRQCQTSEVKNCFELCMNGSGPPPSAPMASEAQRQVYADTYTTCKSLDVSEGQCVFQAQQSIAPAVVNSGFVSCVQGCNDDNCIKWCVKANEAMPQSSMAQSNVAQQYFNCYAQTPTKAGAEACVKSSLLNAQQTGVSSGFVECLPRCTCMPDCSAEDYELCGNECAGNGGGSASQLTVRVGAPTFGSLNEDEE